MLKSTYLQQCAHNKHERNLVVTAINEKGISPVRSKYLRQQLTRLIRERDWLLKIKEEFTIFPNDCFRI